MALWVRMNSDDLECAVCGAVHDTHDVFYGEPGYAHNCESKGNIPPMTDGQRLELYSKRQALGQKEAHP
jgi:hypothetical protein